MQQSSIHQHLLNGINRMLPFVVAGALFAAFAGQVAPTSPAAPVLKTLGPEGGLALMLPILAGFIAQSIAGWDGLLPGMVGGLIAFHGGSGMLGGIIAGYLAGYLVLGLNRAVRLPAVVRDLKPIVILPALSTLAIGLSMLYVINPPISMVMNALQHWLVSLRGQSGIFLGLVLGAMGAFDLGGPVNKAAALFALDLLAVGIAEPLGAVVAGVMAAIMGMALAMRLSPRRYSTGELALSHTAFWLGLSNIGEATIPIAMADPGRVIPAISIGGAVAGGVSMALGVGVRLPVGGFFTILVPGMVTHAGSYLVAIAAGSAATAVVANLLKQVKQ